jgi:hypothetical protein
VKFVRSRLAIAVLAVVTWASAPVRAHDTGSRIVEPTLDALDPRLAGVTVQLQHTLADQLVVENRTGRVLEVLDDAGVPFLRLGPAGAEANVGGTEPRWERVADVPAWGWYDRRLRAASTGAVAERWTVPLRLGGEPLALSGRFRIVRRPAGSFASRVTSAAEPLPGVRVSLVAGRVPALYLENAGRRPVVVLGDAGEPFLLLGPEGTSANLRSPTWLASGKAEVTTVAMRADAHAEPKWERVSVVPRYAWIEFRAAVPDDALPETTDRATVRSWHVPLRRGRERADVTGVVEWIPVPHVH